MGNWMKDMKDENERLKKELAAYSQPASGPATDEPKAKPATRPATKPWNRKDGAYRPYRRDYFNLKSTDPAFRPRFVNAENVESLMDRGYRIADPEKYGGLTDRVIEDGSALGRRIVRRGMVLMERPMEDYLEEQKYKDEQLKAQRRRARQEVREEAEKEFAGTGHHMPVTDETRDE